MIFFARDEQISYLENYVAETARNSNCRKVLWQNVYRRLFLSLNKA